MNLIAALTVLIMLIPNPFDGKWSGAYYYDFNFYWCTSRVSCVHEIGHYLDDRGGMVSQSQAFMDATSEFITQFDGQEQNPYTNDYMELYAHIYEISDGYKDNLPVSLQGFYDWEMGSENIINLGYD